MHACKTHAGNGLDRGSGRIGSLPIVTGKKLMLFAGRANPELAAKIAHKLAIGLGHITLKTFSAGEVYCRFDESVRGADVFIVQPTCGNPETGVTANDAMMELLVMIESPSAPRRTG